MFPLSSTPSFPPSKKDSQSNLRFAKINDVAVKGRYSMKKLLALAVALLLAFCLVSCDEGENPPEIDPGVSVGGDGGINLPVIDYQPPTE